MIQYGTIINIDHNPIFNIGNLYIKKDFNNGFDVVPFESATLLYAVNKFYRGIELSSCIGKAVAYSIDDDGILEGLGDNREGKFYS